MAIPDLSSIITPKQVAAQLGVNSADISDETIKATGVYDDLYLDLGDWFPLFMDVLNSSDATKEIQTQQIAIRSYGKFFVCYQLLISGPLAFFQKVGDGENADARFNINFDKMKADYLAAMDRAKGIALGVNTPMTPVKPNVQGFGLFGVAPPSNDNVRQ